MEEAEYNERLKKVEGDYDLAKRMLYRECGLSRAIYKNGDIIKDSNTTILIDKITVSISFGVPEPVYHGIELRKDLMPKKNGDRGSIYGNHLTELIKSSNI